MRSSVSLWLNQRPHMDRQGSKQAYDLLISDRQIDALLVTFVQNVVTLDNRKEESLMIFKCYIIT